MNDWGDHFAIFIMVFNLSDITTIPRLPDLV